MIYSGRMSQQQREREEAESHTHTAPESGTDREEKNFHVIVYKYNSPSHW